MPYSAGQRELAQSLGGQNGIFGDFAGDKWLVNGQEEELPWYIANSVNALGAQEQAQLEQQRQAALQAAAQRSQQEAANKVTSDPATMTSLFEQWRAAGQPTEGKGTLEAFVPPPKPAVAPPPPAAAVAPVAPSVPTTPAPVAPAAVAPTTPVAPQAAAPAAQPTFRDMIAKLMQQKLASGATFNPQGAQQPVQPTAGVSAPPSTSMQPQMGMNQGALSSMLRRKDIGTGAFTPQNTQ